MWRLFSPVDIPVGIRGGIRVGPRRNCLKQMPETVFRIDSTEVSAIRAQSPKEGFRGNIYSLTNHGNPETGRCWRLWGHRLVQFVRVAQGRVAERVHLVGGPKMGGKLLYKLSRRGNPL